MITAEAKKNDVDLLDRIMDLITPKDKSMMEILPYKKVTKEGILITKDNKYQAYLKVKTTDLTSISDEGFRRMVNKLTYLNRVYLEPFKIMSLTYPTEVIEQISYWNHRIKEAKKELLSNQDPGKETYLQWNLKLARDNYMRIEFVSTLPELTFCIVVYGDTLKEVNNHINLMKQAGGREFELELLAPKEVESTVEKLLNMNTSL